MGFHHKFCTIYSWIRCSIAKNAALSFYIAEWSRWYDGDDYSNGLRHAAGFPLQFMLLSSWVDNEMFTQQVHVRIPEMFLKKVFLYKFLCGGIYSKNRKDYVMSEIITISFPPGN